MQKIVDIYEKYSIMPLLRLHQMRVAAVGQLLCESVSLHVDSSSVVQALLLHDMGNIIKFDLTLFPEALEPQGILYWRGVQNEFKSLYGENEHSVTRAIASEIGVSSKVMELIESVGFSKASQVASLASLEKKICCYSDYRVAPYGVVSLEQSLLDRFVRYKDNPHKISSLVFVEQAQRAFRTLESQIFESSSLKPSYITDESISPFLLRVQGVSL